MRACLLGLVLLSELSLAQTPSEEEELASAFGDRAQLSIATGSRQSLRRAPAVATVFTAEQIRAMGATDVGQVLATVPGLNVARSFYGYEPMYEVRGMRSSFGQQVLVLIDGVRRNVPTNGGPEELWVDMPVDNIARIEVIRGPGSALHGADAFAGLIAITTWRGGEHPGIHLLATLDSQRGRYASLQQGGVSGEWNWHAYARLGRSDGPDALIQADAQTGLDALFGTQASLAPGAIRMPQRALDAALSLGWGHWSLQASLKHRKLDGSGPGIAQALSDRDWLDTRHTTLSLGYQRQGILPDWDLQMQASWSRMVIDTYLQLFPPGAFGGLYPEGMIGAPGRSTRVGALEAVAGYQGLAGHRLRLGVGLQDIDLYATRERKNFDFVLIPGVGPFPAPLGSLVDVSASGPYLLPQRRRDVYGLVQDEWQFAPDWTLTAGLRHDRYSDFGPTTNPRAALVWEARQDLTLKLLTGRAFRAPTFAEMHAINNPVQIGNPDARPERVRMSEFVLAWQASPGLQTRLNLFRYRMDQILRLVPNADPTTGSSSQNLGSQRGQGFEVELNWQARRGLRLDASYSQQRSVDLLVQQDAGDAPHRLWKAGLDWTLTPDWTLNAQALRVAGRQRGPGDTRPPLKDRSNLDLSLQWRRDARQGWRVLAVVRNALDGDVRDPSPAPGNIPGDIPLPRRHAELQLSHGW